MTQRWELLGKRHSQQRWNLNNLCLVLLSGSYLSTMEIAYLKLTPARKKEDPKNRDKFLTTLSILNQGKPEPSVILRVSGLILFHLSQEESDFYHLYLESWLTQARSLTGKSRESLSSSPSPELHSPISFYVLATLFFYTEFLSLCVSNH